MPKKPTQKVCFVYTDKKGELQRTRFFKETSKFILKSVKDRLKNLHGSIDFKQITKVQWELQFGAINNPDRKPVPYQDLKFTPKTHEQRHWCEKLYRRIGRPLAF